MVKYYYDTAADVWNLADKSYSPLDSETEKTESEFLEWKNEKERIIEIKKNIENKKQECRSLILSRYSETDQMNMQATILYEREVLGAVTAETLAEAKTMYDWVKSVQDEFRTNGADADFSRFY